MRRIVWHLKMGLKFIDIGANLTDPMFRGTYGGSQKHKDDQDLVLKRAWDQGMQKIIITVGTLNEADEALQLANKDERLFITMGCHPTRCAEFLPDPDDYFNKLSEKISENRSKVVAIGECGLDYDRLHFCEKETQKKFFEKQFELAARFRLPLFLHCRNAFPDFMEIIERNKDTLEACGGGVVHSFTGTAEEATAVLQYCNLYIGLNGCSLKTKENLEVVKDIPNERIMLETDCPWCGIRRTHAGYEYLQTKFPTVKKKEKWTEDCLIDGRCEPCLISQVCEVIAGVKNENVELIAHAYYENTKKMFFSKPLC